MTARPYEWTERERALLAELEERGTLQHAVDRLVGEQLLALAVCMNEGEAILRWRELHSTLRLVGALFLGDAGRPPFGLERFTSLAQQLREAREGEQ